MFFSALCSWPQRSWPGLRHLIVAIVSMLALPNGVWANSPLPDPLFQALTRAQIPLSQVAIWVKEVDRRDTGEADFSLNADLPLNPASVMKLVTAFALLEQFGPAHTWDTEVLIEGSIVDRTLHGNLYVRGQGDPLLTFERWWKLLRRIRAQGIEHIDGDIVLDGSFLQLPPHDPGAFDNRPLRPYNSGPAGLLLHFNTLNLHLTPARQADKPVQVVAEQPLNGIQIDNAIRTGSGACGTWYSQLSASLEVPPGNSSLRLKLGGVLPASCGPRAWAAAPLSPEGFAEALTTGLWHELGGQLRGVVRTGATPLSVQLWLTDTSPSLAEAVREMNKWSSNVIARQLLAYLGATSMRQAIPTSSSPPLLGDSVRAGANQAVQLIANAGIDTQGLIIENGSGLSRIARIRADTLGDLLQRVWSRNYMPDFIAALPIAGVDGTARTWLPDSPARGSARIKTGSVEGVRAIAGYVQDRYGRRHVVVMMVNHAKAADSRAAQNALLEWVWSGNSRPQ